MAKKKQTKKETIDLEPVIIEYDKLLKGEYKTSEPKPYFPFPSASIEVEKEDLNAYEPKAEFLKNIEIEICWVKWNEEALMSFLNNI